MLRDAPSKLTMNSVLQNWKVSNDNDKTNHTLTLKNVSILGGQNLYPSLTPGFLLRNDPVAIRLVTHSMGIISHFSALKAVSDCFPLKWVLIPAQRHVNKKKVVFPLKCFNSYTNNNNNNNNNEDIVLRNAWYLY